MQRSLMTRDNNYGNVFIPLFMC